MNEIAFYDIADVASGELKSTLFTRGEATDLFGREWEEGIPGSIEQTMFGKPLYKIRGVRGVGQGDGTACDAAYLELAQRESVSLATFDQALATAARQSGDCTLP